MSAALGTLLAGRYRLDARVGAGGMSTVYRAFDQTLERVVAIKLMNREIASDSDQLERFRREARAVAQLSHPHIVTVIDAGEATVADHHDQGPGHGRPYIVFEYVEGETLKVRIRRLAQLPIGEAVAYAIEIARALGAAHARNIVHRDVKPQNVLLDEEGSAKVTDFGIARSLDEEGLTADGRVLGTTDYVSPEQALGHPVTGQSDLYSLGIVLYEMLTGDVPFHGENQVAVAMKHVRETVPDVQAHRPEASAALAAVVDRATSKDLTRRYRNAEEMVAELEDALAIETSRAGTATGEATAVLRTLPSGARRRLPLRLRSPRLAIGLIALLVAGGVVAAVLLSREAHRGSGPPPADKAPAKLHFVRLGSDAAHDYDPFGSGAKGEHPEKVAFAVDPDPNTYWNTENYDGGLGDKPGVGLYVDAAPATRAALLELATPSPGFDVEIYAAHSGPPKSLPNPGWTKVGNATSVGRREKIRLSGASTAYRYYLIWITKLPPGATQARIASVAILR